MLFSAKSAMAKPTTLLSFTCPFSSFGNMAIRSVTSLGSRPKYSLSEFLTNCILFDVSDFRFSDAHAIFPTRNSLFEKKSLSIFQNIARLKAIKALPNWFECIKPSLLLLFQFFKIERLTISPVHFCESSFSVIFALPSWRQINWLP